MEKSEKDKDRAKTITEAYRSGKLKDSEEYLNEIVRMVKEISKRSWDHSIIEEEIFGQAMLQISEFLNKPPRSDIDNIMEYFSSMTFHVRNKMYKKYSNEKRFLSKDEIPDIEDTNFIDLDEIILTETLIGKIKKFCSEYLPKQQYLIFIYYLKEVSDKNISVLLKKEYPKISEDSVKTQRSIVRNKLKKEFGNILNF